MFKRFTALLLILPSLVFAENFVAGTDYKILNPAETLAKKAPAKITEFFSYGCPWCYKLEAPLQSFIKLQGNKIQFERIPVVFHQEWALYAKAFYLAQTLSQVEKFTALLFQAIQVEKKPLNTPESMIKFFVAQGVDKALAQSAFLHSPTLDLLIKKGMITMTQYQISGVPAFVVNGHYKTDLELAKSPERLIMILEHLIHLG